jgi:hypothetical protein
MMRCALALIWLALLLLPFESAHAIDDYYGDQQQYLKATKAEEEAEEASEE